MEIEEKLGISILKLGYIPQKLNFEELIISDESALIIFEYKGQKIHYTIENKNTSVSIGLQSDRREEESVYNDWLKQNIEVTHNQLSSGEIESSAQFYIENELYHFVGIMDEEEFKKIVENIYFFK